MIDNVFDLWSFIKFPFHCSREEVTSFGIWHNSCLKIFVKKGTNEQNLRNDLRDVNKDFIENHKLEFENTRLIKIPTLKQGYVIKRFEEEKVFEGTLGGFVTDEIDSQKKFALTCNHLFPSRKTLAYDEESCEIGTCIYSTRQLFSDFAAIEMNETTKCDESFRREDTKKTNARIYDGRINDICIVHKIGAKSGPTTGSVLCSEYYDKLTGEENFLVTGEYGQLFSEPGDSGALVFSRPLESKQNYVKVVGMVYGTY